LAVAWFATEAIGAQLSIPPVTVRNGSSAAQVEIRLAAAGAQITGLVMDITADAGLTVVPQIGSAASAAGKQLSSSDIAGGKRVVIIGLNQNPIPDGVVYTLTVALPAGAQGSYALHITNASGTDASGNILPLGTADGAVVVGATTATLTTRGVFAQIASGGTWKTTLTLYNPTSTQANVRIQCYSDDGRELPLPFTFPQTPGTSTLTSARVDQAISAGSLLIIETEAAQNGPTMQGWAVFSSDAPVEGYAVFRQRVAEGKDTEAVVPLDSMQLQRPILTFDNTSGFVTGVAIANNSLNANTITVNVRDDLGRLVSSQTILLPSQNHTVFVLSNQFPVTRNGRGTLEFQAQTLNSVSILALRFNPFGSFTYVPLESITTGT
jgi:hypothetical protein